MTDSDHNHNTAKEINSYGNIIKGSSFFGGVQFFNILITLIRGKFVAIILGPEGMGISSLFNSASNTIQRFASMGLNLSITRDIAINENDVKDKESKIRISILLTNITALLGLVICIAFCKPLSRITFGDESYWWQFMILGAGVAYGIAGTGKLAVLQGLHQVKKISFASIVGGLTGLCVGIPLYYLFKDKGIVPAIVAIFLSLYIFYSVSLKRSFTYSDGRKKWEDYIPLARRLLSLGLILMAGEIISTLFGYLINLFIRYHGSLDDVGLYQSAYSITKQFAGVIFTILAMDYFPRLSSVAHDNKEMKTIVNRQSEVVAWLMTPAMTLLILSSPLIIRIFLSEEFFTIIPLMRWMGIGMLLRAFSYPMAYITFAKGNRKVFFILEGLVANSLTLVFSCLFFKWFGLIGLGYALVADNAICIVLYYFVNKGLYNYNFSGRALICFTAGAILTGGCFVFSDLRSIALSYTLMGLFTAFSIVWAFFSIKNHIKPSD